MWVIVNSVKVGGQDYLAHCYKNRVYRERDKAKSDLQKIQHGSSNYKVFKVLLMEDGSDG